MNLKFHYATESAYVKKGSTNEHDALLIDICLMHLSFIMLKSTLSFKKLELDVQKRFEFDIWVRIVHILSLRAWLAKTTSFWNFLFFNNLFSLF